MSASDKSKCGPLFLESANFDDAIALTGYGRFHYEVVSVCALCVLSVGFENGLSSFAFSAAQCELNIQPKDIGLLNVAFLAGGTLSAFVWGVVADLNGRKKVLIATLFLNSLVTILCAFMQTFTAILACRFVNGFLMGCPCSVSFSYLAEFHAPKLRAKSVCYSGIFFTAAWVILPMISYLVLPLKFEFNVLPQVPFSSWRLFLVIISVPEILAAIGASFLPESPKFLVDKSEGEKALTILKQMYAKNYGRSCDDYPVKELLCEASHKAEYSQCAGKIPRLMDEVFSQLKRIFRPPLRVQTYLLNGITFSNMFGFFGLGLWLPEFFIRFEQELQLRPNETITIEDLSFIDESKDINCEVVFDAVVFQNTLIVAGCALLGNVASGWLAGRVNVKTIVLITMFLGTLSSACIYWTRSSTEILLVSSVFQAAMATGNMALGSVVIEHFPTCVGAIALSMTQCFGKIGAIVSNVLLSVLINDYRMVVIFLVSGVILVGTLLCFLTPNTETAKDKCKSLEVASEPKLQIEVSVISLSDSCNVVITPL